MKAVFNLARILQPTVIFFDEIDALMSSRKVCTQAHTHVCRDCVTMCLFIFLVHVCLPVCLCVFVSHKSQALFCLSDSVSVCLSICLSVCYRVSCVCIVQLMMLSRFI